LNFDLLAAMANILKLTQPVTGSQILAKSMNVVSADGFD